MYIYIYKERERAIQICKYVYAYAPYPLSLLDPKSTGRRVRSRLGGGPPVRVGSFVYAIYVNVLPTIIPWVFVHALYICIYVCK